MIKGNKPTRSVYFNPARQTSKSIAMQVTNQYKKREAQQQQLHRRKVPGDEAATN